MNVAVVNRSTSPLLQDDASDAPCPELLQPIQPTVNELVAEGNVITACAIFSASLVLDALNALPSTLVVDVPVSLRTTALVLVTLVAAPPVVPDVLLHQRGISYICLSVAAYVGLHQGGENARIADAVYTLVAGWAILLIFGLSGPEPGKIGYDAKGRRENALALAAALLGYAGMRIARAGIVHPMEVAQFTAEHADLTTRGFAYADDLVASTLVFGGGICVCASVIILLNYSATYEHGCSVVCRVLAYLSIVVFTAAFVVQVAAYSNIDELDALFGQGSCVGNVDVCELSYRARRFYISNSSAAPLWSCAIGLTILAFPYERRCKTRRDFFSPEEREGAHDAAMRSGWVALASSIVAFVVIYMFSDAVAMQPSIELAFLYLSIPVAWFGSTFIACALHTVGIALYTAGRVGSVFGFDLAFLTHWFVAATLITCFLLTISTFASWILYDSPLSQGRFIPWIDTAIALLIVALVSMQLWLSMAALSIVSGYDGAVVDADATNWRVTSLQWCSQHSISFFFSAALVGGRYEPHVDKISSLVLRAVWFGVPCTLFVFWGLSLLLFSTNLPYTAVGHFVPLAVAVLGAAAPWSLAGAYMC